MMHAVRSILQRRFAVAVAVLCFAAALSAQAPEWKSYNYPSEGFRASFPSEPQLQKRDVPTKAGAFELRSYIAQVSSYALFVGVCDYGAQANGTDPDVLLQGAKQGALTNSNSHLVSENKVTLGIYHGIQFEAESDAAHFSARIYMVGDTLYQSLVVSPIGKIYPDTTRFLDSFQLIPRVRN
jgi:hypothetical protein